MLLPHKDELNYNSENKRKRTALPSAFFSIGLSEVFIPFRKSFSINVYINPNVFLLKLPIYILLHHRFIAVGHCATCILNVLLYTCIILELMWL